MQKDAYTNQILSLAVGDGHKLHVVDWGNRESKTKIILLHGGPGSSAKDKHKAPFDPERHHVIFFDQRGAGLSKPTGSLKKNTTQDLIEDISKIAKKFKFESFYLHGSSWGSTLGLAYALAHPENVRGLILGGVFTGTRAELDWIDGGHFKTTFPDVWQAYLDRTPEEFRDSPSAYHFDKIFNGNAKEQKLSAYAYECLEGAVTKFDDQFVPSNFDDYDKDGIKLEIHYLINNCFLPDRHILDNAHKLTMPVWIVQGRYDMVCPPITAYELHRKLPNGKLYWTLSGHQPEHESINVYRAIFADL